jgi:hypothetical protein
MMHDINLTKESMPPSQSQHEPEPTPKKTVHVEQQHEGQDPTENTSPTTTDANTHINTRHIIGNSLNAMTDIINNNIIAARYGAFASVALLTAYGISKTPIFFRYKRVSDIPSSLIKNRQTIHGRIVHVHVLEKDIVHSINGSGSANSNAAGKDMEEPIICLVRHLSPVGRLLNRSAFEFMARMSPQWHSHLHSHLQVHKHKHKHKHNQSEIKDSKDLLKVEIAAIKAPPAFYYAPPHAGQEGVNDWLKSLAASRAPVSCTLLSRRVHHVQVPQHGHHGHHGHNHKTNSSSKATFDAADDHPATDETIICKMNFRPGMTLFRKDLATSLVTFGRANVASGMHIENKTVPMPTITIDGSERLGDIEGDVKYLEKLAEAEFDAVKSGKGMWSVEQIRDSRPDLVEEADFDINAGFWSRLWRRIRHE